MLLHFFHSLHNAVTQTGTMFSIRTAFTWLPVSYLPAKWWRRNGMKTVLIVAGIIVFLVYGFVLYCCIKVGKESDEQYNKLREGKEQEDDRSRVCK